MSLLSGGYFNTPDEDLNARLAYVDFHGESILDAMKTKPDLDINKPKLKPTDNYNKEFLDHHTPNCVEGIDKMCEWLESLK